MPGRKGVKMIPRKAKSGKFRSVRALVFSLLEKNQNIDREEVEKIVMKEYPQSNFVHKNGKGGHFPWYKHIFLKSKLTEAGFNVKDQVKHEEHPELEAVNETTTNARKKSNIRRTSRIQSMDVGKVVRRTKT